MDRFADLELGCAWVSGSSQQHLRWYRDSEMDVGRGQAGCQVSGEDRGAAPFNDVLAEMWQSQEWILLCLCR